jgi:hypothetical protein
MFSAEFLEIAARDSTRYLKGATVWRLGESNHQCSSACCQLAQGRVLPPRSKASAHPMRWQTALGGCSLPQWGVVPPGGRLRAAPEVILACWALLLTVDRQHSRAPEPMERAAWMPAGSIGSTHCPPPPAHKAPALVMALGFAKRPAQDGPDTSWPGWRRRPPAAAPTQTRDSCAPQR